MRHPKTNVCEVELTKGKVALIDAEDYERVSKFKWCASGNGRYAVRRVSKKNIHRYLHRFIMNAKAGEVVDHINHNTFDCRRSNLRICSHQQNTFNKQKRAGCLSKFKGVTFERRKNKWAAQIWLNGRNKRIGYFLSEEEAGRSYDRFAFNHFGRFAKLNFPRKAA